MRKQHFRHFARAVARLTRRYSWLSAFVCLLSASPAAAADVKPGFDCRKAATAVETLICHDDDLKWADQTLAETYQIRRKALSPEAAEVLVRDQKEWLVLRAKACAEASGEHDKTYCLLDFYQKRNRVLLEGFWLGWSPAPDELAARLKDAALRSNRLGICPVSHDFDLAYYERMAADERHEADSIFFEIPRGFKPEVVEEDYRPVDVTPDRAVPSDRIPAPNQLNPHHGLGDAKMKIYCRFQDADGTWWLAHKDRSVGVFHYFRSSEMEAVPARN